MCFCCSEEEEGARSLRGLCHWFKRPQTPPPTERRVRHSVTTASTRRRAKGKEPRNSATLGQTPLFVCFYAYFHKREDTYRARLPLCGLKSWDPSEGNAPTFPRLIADDAAPDVRLKNSQLALVPPGKRTFALLLALLHACSRRWAFRAVPGLQRLCPPYCATQMRRERSCGGHSGDI